MKRFLLFLPLLLLTGCAELQPSWQGFYGEALQQTGPVNGRPSIDGASIAGCAIIGLGKKNSALLEVYEPVQGGAPGYMVGFSRRLF
jgi:hypothetical protein